jgi:large subunit ribosomal protein L1
MGTQRNVDMSMDQGQIKEVEVEEVKTETQDGDKDSAGGKNQPTTLARKKHQRSQKYKAVRAKVDKTRHYDPFSAVELVKKLSYSNFTGTISAHLELKEKGVVQDIEFPYSTGRDLKVEIASEDTLEKIEEGNIDFDVLLAAPSFMSKITKYAPILGPQGLMPNPKNNTLTPNPEQRKQELESGQLTLKTERKAPLIHVPIGKADMETKKIVANLKTLITAFKHKLKKMTIAATMSPGVKVETKAATEDKE